MSLEKQFLASISDIMTRIPEASESYHIAQSLLTQLEKFFEVMQDANPDELNNLEMEWQQESPLFQSLGKLMRTFHDQIKVIRADVPERLGELAHHDMEDASNRLQHIVSMTENAANKTMDLAEELLGQMTEQQDQIGSLLAHAESHLSGSSDTPEQKLIQEMSVVLRQVSNQNQQMQGSLTDILVAQDYQDLTGQVINKVVKLLHHLEKELIFLIETFGKASVEKKIIEGELKGPLHESSEERHSQGDVDDLLASLGF